MHTNLKCADQAQLELRRPRGAAGHGDCRTPPVREGGREMRFRNPVRTVISFQQKMMQKSYFTEKSISLGAIVYMLMRKLEQV